MGDIVIIGGGIAGLTAAIALQRQGRTVRLFEQASEFGEVGAGITLTRPASRGLFAIGLEDAIKAAADVPVRAGTVDFESGAHGDNPNVMLTPASGGGNDIPYFYQIHRADLHNILLSAVTATDPATIRTSSRLVDFAQDADGVTAIFADGSEARGNVLLGADGIHSQVRRRLFGHEPERFTGQVAYRFLVPVRDVVSRLGHGPSVKYTGRNRLLLRYIIRHGTLVNAVGFVPTREWTGTGWSTPVPREELLAQFEGANPDLAALLAAAPIEGARKWALFDRDPLPRWAVGRVTILGDAAHPMLPFLGLGSAMGIEDAIVLSRALASSASPDAALDAYQKTRVDRANAVLLASREQGLIDQRGGTASPEQVASIARWMDYDPAMVPLAA
jgi:salicylate hydroxylase